jgi:hypothetical protein
VRPVYVTGEDLQRYNSTDVVIIPSGMTRDESVQSGDGTSSSEDGSATDRSLEQLYD